MRKIRRWVVWKILPGSFIFASFVLSLLPSKDVYSQTPLPEQDKYVFKHYMLIPWGEGKGKLTLRLEQEKIHPPGPNTPEWALKKNSSFYNATVTKQYAPPTFRLDEEGNVYICDCLGKKPALKKFNIKGNEIASLTDNPPLDFTIQGNKIVVINENEHEVKSLLSKTFLNSLGAPGKIWV